MTSSSGHRSPKRSRACAERTPVFDSRTMIPMAIRTSGKSRPRFRYIAGLSTPNQQKESERDQYRGPDEFPADVTEHAQVGQEEVGAKRNQDDPGPQPWGSVAIRRTPPARVVGRTGGWRSTGGVSARWRWRSTCLRTREAGSKVLPDVLTHRTQAFTDTPRCRRRRALRRIHQETEQQVREDADA